MARALANPELEAESLVHLERLTWTYGLDEQDLTEQLRNVIERLPSDAATLRAHAQSALAMRLTAAERRYEAEQADLARAALGQLPFVTDSPTRADIILGIRGGLQDHDTLDEQLKRDREVLRLGIKFHSAHNINEAISAQIVDLLRGGRFTEANALVRDYRRFAEKNPEPVILYGRALIEAMMSLARGEFQEASKHTAEAARISTIWGGSIANEALMAQVGWTLYETGELDGLTEVLEDIRTQEVNALNQPLWTLSAGLIYAEKGEMESARQALRGICASTDDLAACPGDPAESPLSRSPRRCSAIRASADLEPDTARSWGTQFARLLAEHHDTIVLAGWPAVLLGSKHRFIGQACLAIPDPDRAVVHLTRAVEENREFAAFHIRTRFDLARAHLLQSDGHQESVAEMRRVEQDATALGMRALAAQAVDARRPRSATRRARARRPRLVGSWGHGCGNHPPITGSLPQPSGCAGDVGTPQRARGTTLNREGPPTVKTDTKWSREAETDTK